MVCSSPQAARPVYNLRRRCRTVLRTGRRRRPTGCATRRATASARCCGSGPAAARRAAPAWPARRSRPCAPARPPSAAGSSPRARRPPAGRSRCGGSAPPGLRVAAPATRLLSACCRSSTACCRSGSPYMQTSGHSSVFFLASRFCLACVLRYRSLRRLNMPGDSMQPHIPRPSAQIPAVQWRGCHIGGGAHAQLSKQLWSLCMPCNTFCLCANERQPTSAQELWCRDAMS